MEALLGNLDAVLMALIGGIVFYATLHKAVNIFDIHRPAPWIERRLILLLASLSYFTFTLPQAIHVGPNASAYVIAITVIYLAYILGIAATYYAVNRRRDGS